MRDIIVDLNYNRTRTEQDEKCLFCGSQLPTPAWFVMDQEDGAGIYEVYCDEKCAEKMEINQPKDDRCKYFLKGLHIYNNHAYGKRYCSGCGRLYEEEDEDI